MKKFLLIALAFGMLLSLPACNKTEEPAAEEQSEAPGEEEKGYDESALVEREDVEDGVYVLLEDSGYTSTLSINKTVYTPHEEMKVMYTEGNMTTKNNDSSWICIVPSDVLHGAEALNEENYSDAVFTYAYEEGEEIIMYAPREPGRYDVRLNDNDDNGVEIGYISFTVAE